MRNFSDFIEKIIAKKYFFRIRTCEDLEYFILGCFAAKEIYKQEDKILERFALFYEYINSIYKCNLKKNWAKIIDFHANDNTDSFLLFSDLYKAYEKESEAFFQLMDKNNPIEIIKKNLIGVDSFLELMLKIKADPSIFNINKLNSLDKIYMGFFVYADFDKGEAFFGPLNDDTFINFYEPNNDFKKYIVKENPITPVNDYLSIIKYLTTEENELELFFQLFDGYQNIKKNVSPLGAGL